MEALYGPARAQKWAVVHEDGRVEGITMPADWKPEANRIMGNENGLDSTGFSRHFHGFVDGFGIIQGRPQTFVAARREGGQWFGTPLHGPVLVYRTNDIGGQLDMRSSDVALLAEYVRLSRLGELHDIRQWFEGRAQR